MSATLLSNISTLVIKLPNYLSLPAYCDRPRARKTIIKGIIELLQTGAVEFLYAGRKQLQGETYFEPFTDAGNTTIIRINVIENAGMYFNLSGPHELLLKRFKKELLYNNEHILIDHTVTETGTARRFIEIYTNNRHVQRKVSQPHQQPTPASHYNSI